MSVNILTNPNVCVPLSSVPTSTNPLTLSDKREIWTCTQPSYDPEPNLDMYVVHTGYVSYDPVKFGQECGRANLLLLSVKSHVRSLQCQHQNSHINIINSISPDGRNFHPEGDGGSGRRPLPPDHLIF